MNTDRRQRPEDAVGKEPARNELASPRHRASRLSRQLSIFRTTCAWTGRGRYETYNSTLVKLRGPNWLSDSRGRCVSRLLQVAIETPDERGSLCRPLRMQTTTARDSSERVMQKRQIGFMCERNRNSRFLTVTPRQRLSIRYIFCSGGVIHL